MEIKFKGLHPKIKVIMDVVVIDWMHDEVFFEQGTDVSYPIEECKLMQFTGMKDKDGVDIYDRDSIDKGYESFGVGIGFVKMINGCWMVTKDDSDGNYWNLHHYLSSCKVVGNVNDKSKVNS